MTAVNIHRTLLAVCLVVAAALRGLAQEPRPAPAGTTPSPVTDAATAQEPRPSDQTTTPPRLSAPADWPEPVTDRATFSYLLFDNTELQRAGGPAALRWDVFGWRGGDVHRFWFKSEGRMTGEDKEFEAQALYGKQISPFFDLQAGIRVRDGSDPTRVYAVLGLQGLAPYRFDVEPTLFLSQQGQVSARLTATYDVLLSQRLIVQPRLETNVAVQRDEAIGVGAGWNDAEFGVRLRYELRREFAPYVGVTWKDSFGATHRLTMQGGGDPSHVVVVAGARAWF